MSFIHSDIHFSSGSDEHLNLMRAAPEKNWSQEYDWVHSSDQTTIEAAAETQAAVDGLSVTDRLKRVQADLQIFADHTSREEVLIRQLHSRIRELEVTLHSMTLAHQDLSAIVESHGSSITELTCTVEARDASIAQLERSLREAEGKVEVQASELTQVHAMAKGNAERHDAQTEESERLRSELAKRDDEIATLKRAAAEEARERDARAKLARETLSRSPPSTPRRSATTDLLSSMTRRDSSSDMRRQSEMAEQWADGMASTVGRITNWWMAGSGSRK